MKINKFSSKGFTLIELLIVIAILGVMAAAVLVAINPAKRISQAKDSNIKSDISSIANAMQTYYTSKGISGITYYPSRVIDLTPLGTPAETELKSEPLNTSTTPATSYNVKVTPTGCTTALKTCTEIAVWATLNDTTTSEVWCWRSSTGIAAQLANAAACLP